MFDNFQPIEHSLNENISVLEVAVCQDKNIQGLLCRDKDILLADSENDVLYVIDYNGKLIEVVGQTGNAPLEFLHPTGIAEYMNNIYVLDAKNWVLSSIAVDEEGTIYMGSLDERYPYIICFHRSDNEFINLGQNFCVPFQKKQVKDTQSIWVW